MEASEIASPAQANTAQEINIVSQEKMAEISDTLMHLKDRVLIPIVSPFNSHVSLQNIDGP